MAWLAKCSGIPSTLSSLSPTFKEPSLGGRAQSASPALCEAERLLGEVGLRGTERGRQRVKEKGMAQ